MQAMEISRTALDVEWRRLELIAQNLANANVAAPNSATAYQAMQLLSTPKGAFAEHLQQGAMSFNVGDLAGVEIKAVTASKDPPRLVHEPGNPLANAAGYVAYPAIDHAEQMTMMMKSARSYEANIVAMNTAHEMYSKALEIGRRS
jgi:flagellar basal-body rod protein FlgC